MHDWESCGEREVQGWDGRKVGMLGRERERERTRERKRWRECWGWREREKEGARERERERERKGEKERERERERERESKSSIHRQNRNQVRRDVDTVDIEGLQMRFMRNPGSCDSTKPKSIYHSPWHFPLFPPVSVFARVLFKQMFISRVASLVCTCVCMRGQF